MTGKSVRNLVLVLGDQLDAPRGIMGAVDFDNNRDAVWMAETEEEATHVWCHQMRLVFFFSAMRHLREQLRESGCTVHYHELQADKRRDGGHDFAAILAASIRKLKPQKISVVEPGDVRVLAMITACAKEYEIELEVLPDSHFYCGIDEFKKFADKRKGLLLETFYRHMRKKHNVLMDEDGNPEGGDWNYDKENRESFGRSGPPAFPAAPRYKPDQITRDVIALVKSRYRDHPGRCDGFDLPVTREDAKAYLADFISKRLPHFGKYQDAMWTGEHFMAHSRISALLNVKLISPSDCVQAAEASWRAGNVPLNSAEGFIRQIIGWREYIRGIYWLKMPDYADMNELNHEAEVPSFFWDGETEMACVRDAMENVIENGYAHHIQRLMVLGLFGQLYGVHPYRFHEWHMAMYVDAIDWVSLPNALGMSQFGDGGIVGTKPYCASGNYINKMSNYCKQCRYDHRKAEGDEACPFTTLYWDFLDRHYEKFRNNQRMAFQIKNLERKRKNEPEIQAIRNRAEHLREEWKGRRKPG